jgi:hypothetical protein
MKMKILGLWLNRVYAVDYIPHNNIAHNSLNLPNMPELILIEKVLWLLVLVVLAKPLLRAQTDPKLENERTKTIAISLIIGVIVILIGTYRYLSGDNYR